MGELSDTGSLLPNQVEKLRKIEEIFFGEDTRGQVYKEPWRWMCAFGDIPALKCVLFECDQCTWKDSGCPTCNTDTVVVRHEVWAKREEITKKRIREDEKETRTITERVSAVCTPTEAIDKLNMKEWVMHKYRQKVQRVAMREAIGGLQPGDAVLWLDYSENFKVSVEGEISAAHFDQREWAIFVAVVYCIEGGEANCHAHVFVCEDTNKKDAVLTRYCLQRIVQHLKPRLGSSGERQRLHFFSDSAPNEFRMRRFAAILRELASTQRHVAFIAASFSEAHHGKGMVDAVGQAAKRYMAGTIADLQLRSITASAIVQLLNQRHSTPSTTSGTVQRYWFHSVDQQDHEVPPDGKTLVRCTDYWAWHVDAAELQTRKLACFCGSCMRGDYVKCPRRLMTGNWVHQG